MYPLVFPKAPLAGAFSFALRVLAGLAALGAGMLCSSLSVAGPVKAVMTEILFEDREGEQVPYVSRVLIMGDLMRMDFGTDDEDFILFERRANTAWHVSKAGRRMIGVQSEKPRFNWPKDWKLTRDVMASGPNNLVQLRVEGQLCAEFKSAPILKAEAYLLGEFRKALAGNHARTWSVTPDDLRHPCVLALDVKEAGVEYRDGMLLAARYWDGRVRTYKSHRELPARPELFQKPDDFARVMVGGDQGKEKARQPVPSQRR